VAPLRGAFQVTAHIVGKLVDLLLGSRERGFGLGRAFGSPPLPAARLPANARGPLCLSEKPHDAVLSSRAPTRIQVLATRVRPFHVGHPVHCGWRGPGRRLPRA
jgi:hypothetical protein